MKNFNKIKSLKDNVILDLSGRVVMNGNAEILVNHIAGLKERIEKRKRELSKMEDQQFEFFNELEVKLWETELHLLQGKIKVVKNDKLFASSNISEK